MDELTEIAALKERLKQSKELQSLTLENEIRWMRKHEDLLTLVNSIRQWKSPDGVLQVQDLHWFKSLTIPSRTGQDCHALRARITELEAALAGFRGDAKGTQCCDPIIDGMLGELLRHNKELEAALAAARETLNPFACLSLMIPKSIVAGRFEVNLKDLRAAEYTIDAARKENPDA